MVNGAIIIGGMKTARTNKAKAVPSSVVWEQLWTSYMAALRAGQDVTAHRDAIHAFDRANGFPLTRWA